MDEQDQLNKNDFYKYGFFLLGALIIGGLIYFFVQNPQQNIPPAQTSITVTNSPSNNVNTQVAEKDETPSPDQTSPPNQSPTNSTISGLQTATFTPEPDLQNPADTTLNPTTAPTKADVTVVPTTVKPTSTATISNPATIGVPGITMTKMGEILTKEQNFTCTQSSANDLNSLTCDYNNKLLQNRLMYNTQAYGRDSNNILFIYSTVIQDTLDQDSAIKTLGVIAALPFAASPKLADDARAWVTSQLPTIKSSTDDRVTSIGGIYYRLYGSPKSWFFEMGDSASMD